MPSASLIKEFEQLVGKENVFSSEADRQSYAYDAAVLKPMIPSLVVRPTEVEQLGQVVKRCYEEGIPMTVRGSGTNLTGGTIPDCSDTIVILTTGLNKILEINTEDLYATVQPGVITAKFAAAVAAKGLFYPPDPGSMSVSTIGGNVAEKRRGIHRLRRKHVQSALGRDAARPRRCDQTRGKRVVYHVNDAAKRRERADVYRAFITVREHSHRRGVYYHPGIGMPCQRLGVCHSSLSRRAGDGHDLTCAHVRKNGMESL